MVIRQDKIMEIRTILKAFEGKRILVIGDVMLDHYIWGQVERISPEAPVPVIEVRNEEYRLGGAANVALNLVALGAAPLLFGITGSDRSSEQIRDLLQYNGIGTEGLLPDPQRPTTLKTRIGAASQQIVRLDNESTIDLPDELRDRLIGHLVQVIPDCDGIILEDYNKGLITPRIIASVLKAADEHNKKVAVDPKHKNFFAYTGVYIFKPNLLELQKNLAIQIENEDQFRDAAWNLKQRIKAEHVIITRGNRGLSIFSDNDDYHSIPAFAKEVWDVSGAGDTVISVLALASACGCDIRTAAILANHAAGVVCSKHGTASTTAAEIEASYHDQQQDQVR